MVLLGSDSEIEFSSHGFYTYSKGKNILIKLRFSNRFNLDSEEKNSWVLRPKINHLDGEVYSNEIELGESITETIITNKPPFMPTPMFKEPGG